MSSSFGEKVKITIFGESHGAAVGVVADGLPAGEALDLAELESFMARRAPGGGAYSTQRRETDRFRFLSGLKDGKTCGAPLCAVIENLDRRSGDYAGLDRLPRPGHADFTAFVKYGGAGDYRGGGHFSGRLTAPLCLAGGICRQLLERRGVTVGAHIAAIGAVEDEAFDPVELGAAELSAPGRKPFPVINDRAGEAMQAEIQKALAAEDSLGGILEGAVLGLPAGLGEPMFGGVENRLACAFFGIPAVKGVEFGAGFAAARLKGSENNDPFVIKKGRVVTAANRHGGALGGITSGMPVIFRAAVKPTPSIGRPQQTVDLEAMTAATLEIKGRHDACIVPRAVPCVEAAAAVVALDLLLSGK
ncbi:MAG: chorismate synthase [Peptococcaceae bacterium]|nr:chorismate synthase [Peptococcaceae bacterium]